MVVSGWLSAISALDRRLLGSKLSFSQFVMLSLVLEQKGFSEIELINFSSHGNEDLKQQPLVDLSYLQEINLIEQPEDTVVLVLTEIGKTIMRETYQVVQNRITAPIFINPYEK